MKSIEHVLGSDTQVPFTLKKDGKIEPLNLNLPSGDKITVLFPGPQGGATIVKKLTDSISDEVIVTSNDCGEFFVQLIETDALNAGNSQNIVVKIKRGGEDIVKEFFNVLNVIQPSLSE